MLQEYCSQHQTGHRKGEAEVSWEDVTLAFAEDVPGNGADQDHACGKENI